ncbi:unnamed protein product [Calypogeia fissa]
MMLALYIGAFGSPANKKPSTSVTDSNVTDPNDGRREGEKSKEKGQKIAMIAPVVTKSSKSKAIAMTTSMIMMEIGSQDEKEDEEKKNKKKLLTTMQFILPSKYTMETMPKPINERVKLRKIPKRTVAAITFSGVANKSPIRARGTEHTASCGSLKGLTDNPLGLMLRQRRSTKNPSGCAQYPQTPACRQHNPAGQ